MHRANIDLDLVARLVKAQFPRWADLPIKCIEPSGWDNRSFRLGDQMVVRLPSAAHYSAQVEKEQRWLPILARDLPFAVPLPLALGQPGEGYPWHWSVYSWIKGETVALHRLPDSREFARSLAAFLVALQRIDASLGPAPGDHNFYRGAPLEHYDRETREAIARLNGSIDASKVVGAWEAALGSRWRQPPVWVHGDISAENLLVSGGGLKAVIDFGCCGVGDPACDLVMAWTFFGPRERAAFRSDLPLDPGTWTRGRGWALWKALTLLAGGVGSSRRASAQFTLMQALEDHDAQLTA